MATTIGEPPLIQAVEEEAALALVASLRAEIAELRRALADVEAEAAEHEHHADAWGSIEPESVDELIEKVADELLASARAQIRRTIEEPALLVAAGRLERARSDAAPAKSATVMAEAAPSTVAEPVADPAPPGDSGGAAPPPAAVAGDAFDAFWREHDDADAARASALAPLDVLIPMGLMLLLLVVVLHFV